MAKHINFYKCRTGVENLMQRFDNTTKSQYIVIDGVVRRIVRINAFAFDTPKLGAPMIRETINNLLYKSYLTEVRFTYVEGGREVPSIFIGCGYVLSKSNSIVAHFEDGKVTVYSYTINALTDPFTKFLKSQITKATKDGWTDQVVFDRKLKQGGDVISVYDYENDELKDTLAKIANTVNLNITFKLYYDI
jgi:hypothetical protein